jgi:anti-sigma factor RsiW
MIPVPRSVIVDLLPLYLAGELSPETQTFIEELLKTDEELAARVRAASAESLPLEESEIPPLPDLELRSVRRTRSLLALQRWLFGLALAFSAVGLSVVVKLAGGRVENVHLMVLDYPIPLGSCLLAGAGCWLGYHGLRRRLGG